MRSRLLALLSLVALLAAACGSDEPDALGVGRELDRCSVITIEEAESFLGGPVTAEPTEDLDGEPSEVTCLYTGGSGSVLVQVRDGAVFHAEPGSSSRSGEDVAGIGEDAFFDGDSVQFLQNDWSVSVSQILGLVDRTRLEDMARTVAGRLP